MRDGVFSIAALILLTSLHSAVGGAAPLPPEGAFQSSSRGGQQNSRTYITGSDRGTITIFYNMANVADRFITKNGREIIDSLSVPEYTTSFNNLSGLYDGEANSITVIFNPGGNPNPTTAWSYSIDFEFNEGTTDFNTVNNDFVALDNQVIPGVSTVSFVRNASSNLGSAVNRIIQKFPPPVRLVRNPDDPNQALLLPTRPVSPGEINGLVNSFESNENTAETAFNNLSGLNFQELADELAPIAQEITAIPDAVAPARDLVATLQASNIGGESNFQDIDTVRSNKDEYDDNRDKAAKGFLGAVRKVNLLKKAGGKTNRVMRNEGRNRKQAQFARIFQLIARERGILLVSHQGILFRIR